jgi:xanthine dehydrogenase accessory factor
MIKGELAHRAERLAADRVPFVVATVVRALHPRSVRPGDAAVVLADGTIEGFVGGVCAQASVRLHALRVLETGEPLLLRLVPGNAAAEGDAGDGAVLERNPCLSGGSLEILLEPQLPAPRIVVVGDAPVARTLERVASAAGYDVVRGAGELVEQEPGAAAVVVASHGQDEERVLSSALLAGVPYVALVASAVRGEAVRASLDVPDELRSQLHTPAGLPLGAADDAEIAIAILAQLVAERHAHPEQEKPAATTAIDPVCGMEVAAADTSLHLDIDGRRVFFCCERCRDAYAEQHAHDVAAR